MIKYIIVDEIGIPIIIGDSHKQVEEKLMTYIDAPDECHLSDFFIVDPQMREEYCLGYYMATYPIGYKEELRYAYSEKFRVYLLESN